MAKCREHKKRIKEGMAVEHATTMAASSTRLLSTVLLLALAALIGIVLAALESMKAAALA